MIKDAIIDRIEGATDIVPKYAGEERCAPGHSFGPAVRDNYLLHFCLAGNGTLYNKHGAHQVSTGELFVIRPGEITTYTADSADPWHYVWIGFTGKRAEIFNNERSVYPCNTDIFRRLSELIDAGESSADIYTALIHEIIYTLFSSEGHAKDTLSNIRRYIRYNYMNEITAESVCHSFGYDRTYLYRIFKKRYNTGIKEYIIRIRMENAKTFLEDGATVCDTARMTGYHDEFNFSKAYKKYWGVAPSYEKRKEIK